MPNDLPPEIDVVSTPQGERYELPARKAGCLRPIAAVPLILFGVVFGYFGLNTALVKGGLWGLVTGSTTVNLLDLFTALIGLLYIFTGLGAICLGVMLTRGRSIIELRDNRLIATQCGSPLRWRREVPLEQIRKFQIKSSNTDEATIAIGASLSALNVVMAGGNMYNLAWGYPKPMLRALADRLSERCETIRGARLLSVDRLEIEVEERTLGQERFAGSADYSPDGDGTVPPQPANSTVILEHNDADVTITVPPVGIRKGAKGLFGLSIFWNVFMTVFTGMWMSGDRKDVSDLLIVIPFFSLFWAIGIGMLVAAINAGRRKAILDVVGDTLLITRQNIFKTRQQEVHRDNIKSIRRDRSGVKVKGVPILNLQIRLHEGKKISLFSQLSDDELGWLAAVLREALDVPSR